jgi:hypothetical protein
LSLLSLAELDGPLALLVVPVRPNDLSIEGHVLSQIERLADLVEVLPDIRRVAEETRPVGVQRELVGVCVGRDVTGTARVSILQPSACIYSAGWNF